MPTLSPDGRWYWNGQVWMPVPPARDVSTWWSDAPDWIGPVLLNGLILFIPIVGQMVVYGWVLAARDELRAGRNLVPPASFSYLSRGWRPFLAQLVWALYCWVVVIVLAIAFSGFAAAAGGQGGLWVVPAVAFGVLTGLAFLATIVLQYLLIVPVIAIAAEVGMGPAISPAYVWAVIRAHAHEVRRGALIYFVGYLLTLVSGFLCVLAILGVFALSGVMLSLAAPLARVRLTAPPAAL